MNRVIKSAFALSLMFFLGQLSAQTENIDDFLGLESEVLPELKGTQRFTKEELHHTPEWNITQKQTVIDKEPLKGQNYSIIPWKDIDTQKFLDINTWLVQREFKDKNPDWMVRLRDITHAEMLGKILKCSGKCQLFRGVIPVNGQHLTRVLEGDEITTDKESSAWIYLVDGTLVRLGNNTSVSFQEFNFAPGFSFHLVRLNQGHIFRHPRSKKDLPIELGPETDAAALPLLIRAANLEHFERERFARQNHSEHLMELMDQEEGAVRDQYQKINELKNKHNQHMTLTHRVMLVAPNTTIVASDASFDLLHVSGGKSFIKKRSESSEFELHLRGYTKEEPQAVTDLAWHEVDANGRSYSTLEEVPGELQVSELITKRIKSLELAREYWLEEITLPIFASLGDPKKLATQYGYNIWQDEIARRLDFLAEYTRRVETTNLRAKENLLGRLEAAGEKQHTELNASTYQAALNHYLFSLKTRYTNKKMQVREFSDLQYYVWILKNGKL